MKKTIYFFALIFIISCKVIDPEELVPAYIYIKDIKVNTQLNQGSSSDKITDAWIYVNGNNIGIYEIPAKIPIHSEGNYELEIFAGIKNSSLIPSLRMKYPFFTSFKKSMIFEKNKIDTLTPEVEYENDAQIWVEDFEDPGIKFTSDSTSDTTLNITHLTAEVFEGNGSGKIIFEPHYLRFSAKTNEVSFNSFPKYGDPIMMELNYKGNAPITIGIYRQNTTTSTPIKEPYYTLNPSINWNKTYLNLMTIITQFPNSKGFDIYIEVKQNTNSNAEVFLDNIKVIY